jgi:hypothetical protein
MEPTTSIRVGVKAALDAGKTFAAADAPGGGGEKVRHLEEGSMGCRSRRGAEAERRVFAILLRGEMSSDLSWTWQTLWAGVPLPKQLSNQREIRTPDDGWV